MYCKNCGSEIADGAKFCSQCGTPVEAAPQAARTVSSHSENFAATTESPKQSASHGQSAGSDVGNAARRAESAAS